MFSPRRLHEVMEWTGDRTMIIAYTPDCLGKLGQEDLDALYDHGFPVPLSQLPGCRGDLRTDQLPAQVNSVDVEEVPETDEGEPEWTMYLDLEPGLVQVADARDPEEHGPSVQKTEVNFTQNIEEILAGLTGPLEVTYTVNPEEVMANIEAWRPR